jgi:hypothetical protein
MPERNDTREQQLGERKASTAMLIDPKAKLLAALMSRAIVL